MLDGMTSMTDSNTPPPADSRPRLLRRSSTDRVASGVCGGLGEYFGVDPVIFRVLFATTAFFGAGIVAYLVAWAAIPERGTATSSLDRVGAELRRRRVPAWVVVGVGAVAAWLALFSWWSPWPFFPVAVATVILVIALGRRKPQAPAAEGLPAADPAAYSTEALPIDLSKSPPPARSEFSVWIDEARQAARTRRHRAAPLRWGTLGVLALTFTVLALIDAHRGVVIPAYFWAVLIVVGAGLLAGLVLRRTPWVLAFLLPPAVLGAFVFNGTHASLHDGSGDNTTTPRAVSDLHAEYRQAFGRTMFDLTDLNATGVARTIKVQQAAGQVRLIVPRTLPVVVHGSVHLGAINVDGRDQASGMNISRDIVTTGVGTPLTIDVRINAGQISIEHVG